MLNVSIRYSPFTINKIVKELLQFPSHYTIAFLSTPSLYFSLPVNRRENCCVFDFDLKWRDDKGFVFYDFHNPLELPPALFKAFDVLVIDPPFITREVWEKYAITAQAVVRDSSSKCLKLAFTVILFCR